MNYSMSKSNRLSKIQTEMDTCRNTYETERKALLNYPIVTKYMFYHPKMEILNLSDLLTYHDPDRFVPFIRLDKSEMIKIDFFIFVLMKSFEEYAINYEHFLKLSVNQAIPSKLLKPNLPVQTNQVQQKILNI